MARFIQRNNLAVDYRALREVAKHLSNVWELSVERFAAAREQGQLGSRLHGDGAIAIKLDLVNSLGAIRELRYTQTLHSIKVTFLDGRESMLVGTRSRSLRKQQWGRF